MHTLWIYMNVYCTSRWAGWSVGGWGACDNERSILKGICICIFHWHIQTNILVSLSQADKHSICLKSWRDKKKKKNRSSSLSFCFVSFMGHKLKLLKQLGVVGVCTTEAVLLLEDSWRVTDQEIKQMNKMTERAWRHVRFSGAPAEMIIQASSLINLFASFPFLMWQMEGGIARGITSQ